MNERLTAIVEHEGDDGCVATAPKLSVASRGTALADVMCQLFEVATAKVVGGQSRVCASGLISCGSGFGFE